MKISLYSFLSVDKGGYKFFNISDLVMPTQRLLRLFSQNKVEIINRLDTWQNDADDDDENEFSSNLWSTYSDREMESHNHFNSAADAGPIRKVSSIDNLSLAEYFQDNNSLNNSFELNYDL